MSEDPLNVLVAGYQDLGAAHRDFDVLCGLVKDKQVTTEYGVILVAKDPDGEGSLRLHRNREKGRIRPQASHPRRREDPAPARRCKPSAREPPAEDHRNDPATTGIWTRCPVALCRLRRPSFIIRRIMLTAPLIGLGGRSDHDHED